jgi:hypothetical protein
MASTISNAQQPKKPESSVKVRYSVLSQRWLTDAEIKRLGNVYGVVRAVRMRFINESDWYIWYLASSHSILPQGYTFFRKIGETQWNYLPQSRGREGPPGSEFTGVAYAWLELPPGAAIDFEAHDWNDEEQEHAFSTFVKTDRDAIPVEIVSNTFGPLVKR